MRKSNCQAGCKVGCSSNKKRDLIQRMDDFQEYLLRGTYILGSCLIIFSLMMFNGALSSNPENPGDNFVTVSANSLALAVQDMWYDTALVAEVVGEDFNNIFIGAIRGAHQGLAKLFVTTGNVLAAVPEVLSTPPYAYARGR